MRSRIPLKNKVPAYPHLTLQKRWLEENYDFLHCHIHNNMLICTGCLQPNGCKQPYKFKMVYVTGKEPVVTILSPHIDPCKEIHMYNDHSLCLHYRQDMLWNEKIKLFEYTIPWIVEWIIFYELYLVNGNVWKGKESPAHLKESDKQEISKTDI